MGCFDPVRREIARLTLYQLVQDGRIHPARIEEVAAKVKSQIEDEIIETGKRTMIDLGRLKRISNFIGDEPFFMTYGDGVSDVDINALLNFHKKHGKLATMSAVKPESRFGVLDLTENNEVRAFREKSDIDSGWINAGFMVLEPKVLDYIKDDTVMFEREPMEQLAREGQLMCCKHNGFWQCMDTLRDKERLEKLWNDCTAPWKVWSE